MVTEQDIRRMASEELANKFNRLLDNGKNVLIRVNYIGEHKDVYVLQDSSGNYVIKSGELPIRCTDVYMTAYDYTVRLNADIGNVHAIYHTMVTEDVQLITY